jgi:hypothetical protein
VNSKVTSALYLITSMMGAFAMSGETKVGVAAAYLLFAASVIIFFSESTWGVWMAVLGSVILAFYVVRGIVGDAISHPEIYRDTETLVVHGVVALFVVASVFVSGTRIIRSLPR